MAEITENEYTEIEYEKWGQVVIKAQLIIACIVCAIEVINNIILYVTRSQGYGPDTIVQKLIRYLLITSVINFGMVVLSKIVERRVEDEITKRYCLMLFTTLMCTDVAYSHYQFSVTFAIFTIPLVISILYEDKGLTIFTLVISMFGNLISVAARANDLEYNRDIGPEAAIAFSLPISIYLFSRLITTTLENRRLKAQEAVSRAEKANANAEKMALSFKMLETLAGTIDAKDKYTNGHSMRVATYATMLAENMGWSKESIATLRYESLLHDIGKIGVPDEILNKPSKLSDVEFDLIKSHTVVGADILKNMVAVPNATEVAKYHHERFDGRGYPSGISEYEIPENARIVCIADAFDAMNSDRIYRKALSREVIREELVKGRGSQFDPNMLDVFLKLFDDNKLGVKTDTYFALENDSNKQDIMNDIESVIGRLASLKDSESAITEFDKFYKYMRNIGLRYERSIEVMSIDLESKSKDISYKALDEAASKLEVAIRKNIRAVDVYYRYSPTRHMMILLDAGAANIDVIQQRVQYDFELNPEMENFIIKFSLNESIEPPKGLYNK